MPGHLSAVPPLPEASDPGLTVAVATPAEPPALSDPAATVLLRLLRSAAQRRESREGRP